MVEYRQAIAADCRALAELRWDFRAEDAGQTPVVERATFVQACSLFLEQGLASKRWVYWIAVRDGEVVAHICVQRIAKVPKPARLEDTIGYVTNVYARADARNQGIGSRLMEYVVTWARGEDLELLLVWPSDESVSFYGRAGFMPSSELMELILRPD